MKTTMILLWFAGLAMFKCVSSVKPKNSTVLTPTYSKVSQWGAPVHVEGRSSGQSLFTQRSEAKIRTEQRPQITYHYVNSRVDNGKKIDNIPAKGEAVIQDRFNPPPYFDYAGVSSSKGKPSIVYGTPFQPNSDDGPPSNSDAVDAMPSSDPYDSPVNSYKPVASGLPADSSYSFKPSKPDFGKFPAYVYDPPPSDSDTKYMGPYAPPNTGMDSSKETMMDGNDDGPPLTQTAEPPMDDQPPEDHHHHHHHHPDDDSGDLAPPPPPPLEQAFSKGIPEYLDHDPSGRFKYDTPFNFDDHHHHVYHEVKTTTTTTTEAPEDERVNKGHFSYYYLGRKLWYIPLYFSVYFIIYIAVLILKSIARHKVNFVHDWDKGKGRSNEEVAAAAGWNAADIGEKIDSFRKRYIAM